jgi:hypothetical protein
MPETELSGTVDLVIEKINDSVFVTFDSKDVAQVCAAISDGFTTLAEAIKEAAKTVWLESQ